MESISKLDSIKGIIEGVEREVNRGLDPKLLDLNMGLTLEQIQKIHQIALTDIKELIGLRSK